MTNPLLIAKAADLAIDGAKSLIDRIWPDKEKQAAERAAAEAHLEQIRGSQELQSNAQRISVLLAEAQSEDPWTSRARPSFLYVMYALILFSIPMGFLSAWRPDLAVAVANGMKAWLGAIPEELWYVFGVGYLGYTGAREVGKSKRMKAIFGGR